jgi:hypothetical protein
LYGGKTFDRERNRPDVTTRARVKDAVGRQQRQPPRRGHLLQEVPEVVGGRAKSKQTLNVALARVRELRQGIEFWAPQPKRGEGGPEDRRGSSEQLPHLLHEDRRVHSIVIELAEQPLVFAERSSERRRSCPHLYEPREAALILALLVLLELLQPNDGAQELLLSPYFISPRESSNGFEPLLRIHNVAREPPPGRPIRLGRQQPLEGLSNAVRSCTRSLREVSGRVLSDKPLGRLQKPNGLTTPVAELGDEVIEQFPILRVFLGHTSVLKQVGWGWINRQVRTARSPASYVQSYWPVERPFGRSAITGRSSEES